MENNESPIVRVAATSKVSKVAGAICGRLRSSQPVIVQAIGAEAVNKAVKAIALAGVYMKKELGFISTLPEVVPLEGTLTFEGETAVGVRFPIIVRQAYEALTYGIDGYNSGGLLDAGK